MEKPEKMNPGSGSAASDYWVVPLVVFGVSYVPSLFPTLFLSSRTMKKIYNRVNVISAGILLSILFMDFMPYIVSGSCGHHHGHAAPASISHFLKHAHIGLFLSGLTFMGLIVVDRFLIKHRHCTTEETQEREKKKAEESVKVVLGHSHKKTADAEASIRICCTEGLKYKITAKQALVFITVFSIHSIFEGLAFGAEKLEEHAMLMLGLCIHKLLESVTVGISLFSSQLSRKTCALLLLFYSVLTPFGMLTSSLAQHLFTGWFLRDVFNGLSFGSLAFILLVEVLPPILHTLTIQEMLYFVSGYILGAFMITFSHYPFGKI